jgi:hypothetical protein
MTKEEFIEQKLKEPNRSTLFGYHFIQQWNENKRNFYLKYVLGLTPTRVKPGLILGRSIHDAMEALYKVSTSIEDIIDIFNELMKQRSFDYEDPTLFNNDVKRGRAMLMAWANRFLEEDLKEWRTLYAEVELEFKLANGFPMTCRIDQIRQSPQGIFIIERKTTGYSINNAAMGVFMQDQSTTYLLACKKCYPDIEIIGVLPEMLYAKGNVAEAQRPIIVSRSDAELQQWEMMLIGLFGDLYAKLLMWKSGFPDGVCFPRNGKDNSFFGDEYGDISRRYVDPEEVPTGYNKDPEAYKRIELFMDVWSKTENPKFALPKEATLV